MMQVQTGLASDLRAFKHQPPCFAPHHMALPAAAPQHVPADDGWAEVMAGMDVALQPIVNIHTGACYGYEALLRGYQDCGFDAPQDVFDVAHALGDLGSVELKLRSMAVAKFGRLANRSDAKLFLNIDNRTLAGGLDLHKETIGLIRAHGLDEGAVVLEISERHPLGHPSDILPVLESFRRQNFRIAIDDFGTGFSGLQMLYFAEPDFLKIDRFFISDIANDAKKKLFLAQIVNIAHMLGVIVLAEGVETEREYLVCKEIGCDLLQGYLVQRPTVEIADLRPHYEEIAELSRRDRRTGDSDQRLLRAQITDIAPLAIDASMDIVLARFRAEKSRSFFPVVDGTGQPVGVVRDEDLKDYTYSRYGQALMSNRAFGRRLKDFVVRCPVADVNAQAENILHIFSGVEASEGVLMVDGLKYTGFLSAHALLKVINEKNLAAAREQNPLTRLPGNNAIHAYVSGVLDDTATDYVLAYFDFDNFKPFNDSYGFRLGDRAILLFAESISKEPQNGDHFAGHVGGDDFFAGFRDRPFDGCIAEVQRLITSFGHDVESFYDEETRRRGWLDGHDRQGNACRFPLLGVSAAVVRLPAGRPIISADALSRTIADLKKQAKAASDHLALGTMWE